ncbi:MAG: hypothetical protein K940chlam3_00058 [Chlamydiae bacterium]|nr:hypothetical protein [Chlamydiota bacterium]
MRKWILIVLCLLIPTQVFSQFLEKPRKNKYKYFISVTAMFNQEAPYLKEWIEYHKLIGVEHFYLYNNSSEDHYLEVLQPYVDSGEVDLIDWPSSRSSSWVGAQYVAVDNALEKAKTETRWLAIIDIDEFFVPLEHYSLIDFLEDHEEYGQIVVMWRYYGTSNVEKIPSDKLLIETLLYREEFVPGKVNKSKCIVKPKAVLKGDVHICELIPSYKTAYYNEGLEEYPPIILNHYWTRDIDFLMSVKHERQQRLYKRPWTEKEKEYYQNIYNDVLDDTMLFYEPFLRDAVFGGP